MRPVSCASYKRQGSSLRKSDVAPEASLALCRYHISVADPRVGLRTQSIFLPLCRLKQGPVNRILNL